MAVRIGLVGMGTVGGGCVRVIQAHKEDIKRNYGVDLELARVCSLSSDEAIALGVEDLYTNDYNEIVNDPDIDVVIELIGGTTIARSIVMKSLQAGKSVVTANKALLAACGEELSAAAMEAGVEIAFEASVGGGIPVIGPMKHSLLANEITSIMGIVNGTTNYMLTRMAEEGIAYDEVLRQAQALGYAEANPSADVDGHDAAAKISILASIAFNSRVSQGDVYTRGISNISPLDLEAAANMGYVVKLLAIAHRTSEGIDVRVHPTMIPVDHQLAKVNGVLNAIYVIGDFVGETMYFGSGAGSHPTASAVMGDVIEVARHIQQGVKPVPGVDPIMGCLEDKKLPIQPVEDLSMKYYIRFPVADRPGVLAAMAGIFAKHNVSVHSVLQRGQKEDGTVNIVYITHVAKESAINAVLEEIASLDDVLHGEPSLIRVEE
ncbi:MAG: homoserine dehydrogenase [Eggerthellaceae bacterium]|nr:homoserine dehydrogenase [Eggerthellaceae bacterium]